MNRRKFERFAEKNGLPLERLSNDSRYESLETEWAWRGYCEAKGETQIATSTVNHLTNRAKPFMTRRNVGRFREAIKETVVTGELVPDETRLSAKRWSALIKCARIRPLGSAGLSGSSHDPHGVEWGNRAHLGLELWTVHSPHHSLADERKAGVEWLTKFADKAILANKERGDV